MISIIKLIQYSLFISAAFVMMIIFGIFLESIKYGEMFIIYIVNSLMLFVLVFSYLFSIKWIAKYDLSRSGVSFVTSIHLMVLFMAMFLPPYVFLDNIVPLEHHETVFGGIMIFLLIVCYIIIRKWDIILFMRKRYYKPSSYSREDWYIE
ncbi:hypothetical protein SAMN05877842_11972 [Ureibacillus acetophenoni]|uniref:Uncharacterized protein n=1 Tax=Ureibacillus acetophenoni TaxID=614649 RepID=A0A285UR26_9BACL|nr:hypothetical protein SAMN05877842_11972 [Ureibacillus acetophenoni]